MVPGALVPLHDQYILKWNENDAPNKVSDYDKSTADIVFNRWEIYQGKKYALHEYAQSMTLETKTTVTVAFSRSWPAFTESHTAAD